MVLSITNLSSWYGQAQALWNVSLQMNEGEVIGVLGRNGAGKTTLLRSIMGLQNRIAGTISSGGLVLSGMKPHGIALSGLALLREGGQLPASLTVAQNLMLGQRLARRRGRPGRTFEEIWRWFPMLEPLVDRRAGLLSGGQRQALALALAFVSEPKLILLDEPSAGLSPPVARDLFQTIKQLSSSGMTVLAVEQHPAWLLGLAARGYLLEVGKVIAEGSISEMLAANRDKII
jgi:branched-chain amino acid transport system ATP-binding protein